MIVLVSAGHHGRARGAVFEGFSEYPETSIWADALVTAINEMKETRHHPLLADYPAAMRIQSGLLRDKVVEVNEICKASPVFCAIEIHFNSAAAANVRGSETLYAPGSQRGRGIAQIVQRYLAKTFPPDRGIKEGWYRMDRPGIIDYQGDVDGDEKIDFWLRKTQCPALIVEPEFIQNNGLITGKREEGITQLAEGVLDAFMAPATRQ